MAEKWKQWQILFPWAPKSLCTMTAAMKLKDACSMKKSYDKPRQCVEKQRHYSVNKGPYSQGYGLPSGHIQLWELDCKEGSMSENWCLWIVVPGKTPENPLDSKEIKPVNPTGNQHVYSLERLMLKLQYCGHLMRRADSLERPWYWER